MSTATVAANYAHTIARMAGCDPVHLLGLDIRALDVLYFGILSDDAAPGFRSMVNHLETAALELYALKAFHSPAERAYCQLELARRDIKTRQPREL